MDKYELRWGRMFSRREEERPRHEPSQDRGRSWERSPRRPAFRADRVPPARDRRGEGAEDVGAGIDGHAGGMDQSAWLRDSARGIGVEGGSHSDAGERDAEGTERNQGRLVEEADEEDGNEVQSEGTSEAEPGPAEESAGASQTVVKESRTTLQESHGRDGSRGEGQRVEGSRRQEQGAPDEGARDAQAPRPHGKEGAERSRTPEKSQHHGEWRVGEFCPHVRRQDQEGGNGGGTRSPGRRQACDAKWRDEPRSPRPQGRQKGRHGAERVSREWRGPREGHHESGGSRQEGRTEGGTLAHGAERARESREGMQRARVRGAERGRPGGASESWGEGRVGAASTPRVEVPSRFSGDQRAGPALKNYLMQVGNVRYRCDLHNMDPVDFFFSLPNALEGEAETLYRMRMEELLWRAGSYGEDPTEAFLERGKPGGGV
ncbi:unnamed protein product [Closterium sp. NIES-53]